MEHHSPRKYRGPETWAKAREAYLAGETGPMVAKRFDLGLGNLRKRASAEGWTRRRFAVTTDAAGKRTMKAVPRPAPEGLVPASAPAPAAGPLEPVSPEDAVAAAASLAASLIAAGRSAEALTTLKAAEALARLTGAREPAGQPWKTVWTPPENMKSEAVMNKLATEISERGWEHLERRVQEVLGRRPRTCRPPCPATPSAGAPGTWAPPSRPRTSNTAAPTAGTATTGPTRAC